MARGRSPLMLAGAALLVVVLIGLLEVGLRTFGSHSDTLPARRPPPPKPLTLASLRALPGVAEVVVARQQNPSHRIIHLLNWHALELEHFTADLRAAGEEPAGDGLEQYDRHLDDVEALQNEQIELLRALVDRHGIQAVCQEGLAPGDMPRFQKRIDVV